MMEIFLDKVNVEISKAEEYVKLNASKHPDVLRMLIESLQDSVRLLPIHSTTKKPPNDDLSKVLAGAQSMLQILKSTLDRVEGEKKLARTSSPISVQFDRVEIPKFRGDPLKYRHFITLFTDRIDSNSSLSNIEKFMLLKTCLEGDVLDVIDEVPITEQNYILSLNLLEKMYGDNEKCIDSLFRRMEAIPAVSVDEIAVIRKTYWKLEAVLLSLEQCYERVNENSLLPAVYKEKFVKASSLEIEKFPKQLDEIRKHVLRIIQERERLESAQLVSFKKSPPLPDSDVVSIKQGTSKTAAAKKNINSVSSNEMADKLLEDPRPTRKKPLTDDFLPPQSSAMTTRVVIEAVGTGQKTSVRLIMTCGPISLISKSAAARMGIKYVTNAESMVLRTTRVPDKFLVHLPNARPVPLGLHVVESVCDEEVFAPTLEEFKKVHPHLAHMDFPDPGYGSPVEMLIGSDTELALLSFREGLNGEEYPSVKRGWSLVSTPFGWIILGPDRTNE